MKIDMLAFDADDTLWHTETLYIQTQQALIEILRPWPAVENINEIVYQIEMNNLPRYGYGIKAFILSLIEAAIHISEGEIQGDQIRQIIDRGKSMLDSQVDLFPHVTETLAHLARSYPMMIITKGDLLDQTEKVKRSGLQPYFSQVEIVDEKTPEIYAKILTKYNIDLQNFLMVGNSIRSDIRPVLALGGIAVHIPANTIWEHEMVPDFNTTQNGYHRIDHIGQLTGLIEQIIDAD